MAARKRNWRGLSSFPARQGWVPRQGRAARGAWAGPGAGGTRLSPGATGQHRDTREAGEQPWALCSTWHRPPPLRGVPWGLRGPAPLDCPAAQLGRAHGPRRTPQEPPEAPSDHHSPLEGSPGLASGERIPLAWRERAHVRSQRGRFLVCWAKYAVWEPSAVFGVAEGR